MRSSPANKVASLDRIHLPSLHTEIAIEPCEFTTLNPEIAMPSSLQIYHLPLEPLFDDEVIVIVRDSVMSLEEKERATIREVQSSWTDKLELGKEWAGWNWQDHVIWQAPHVLAQPAPVSKIEPLPVLHTRTIFTSPAPQTKLISHIKPLASSEPK